MKKAGKINTVCSIFESFDIPHKIKFVVIAAQFRGNWVFVRQKHRDTYELPGGHVERGENVIHAARRELYEESGIVAARLYPVCAYSVSVGSGSVEKAGRRITYGKLFYAEALCMAALPPYEMEEVRADGFIPDLKEYSHPEMHPALFAKATSWLQKHKNDMPANGFFYEKVCGAVTYCVEDQVRKYLLIKNLSGHIGFPKGHAENDESELDTARREVLEETGLRPEFSPHFRYSFYYTAMEKNHRIHKQAVYFTARFEHTAQNPVQVQEAEILNWWLVPLPEAMDLLNKENDRTLLLRADAWIAHHMHASGDPSIFPKSGIFTV